MRLPRLRKRAEVIPRVGEIFSLAQSGLSGFGFHDGGQDDDGPDTPPEIHGIQTQSEIDITTQGGGIIQAQNQ